MSDAARVQIACTGPLFTIEPRALFDRAAPLEIELGAGRGDFILERAAATPERNFLAVELAATIAQLMAVRAARSGIDNLKVVRMDARTLVNLMLPEASVDAFHIYFPGPVAQGAPGETSVVHAVVRREPQAPAAHARAIVRRHRRRRLRAGHLLLARRAAASRAPRSRCRAPRPLALRGVFAPPANQSMRALSSLRRPPHDESDGCEATSYIHSYLCL